jgi:UDP-N-acetylglucosamine 2-epimerase
MIKIFVASTNRSETYLSKLISKMKENNLYTDDVTKADYIFMAGDRIESFYYAAEKYTQNKKIIQYAAGEISQGCHDEVFRHSITLMSCLQLCANSQSFNRVRKLCYSVDKEFNANIVGNLLLDNLEIDESVVPSEPYNLILYNPPTL